MYLRSTFKPIVLIAIMAIPLIVGTASIGYAGGPQPGPKDVDGPELIGKAVDGLLSAVVVDPADLELDQLGHLSGVVGSFVVQHIVVICKGEQVVYGPAINSPSSYEADLARTKAECTGVNDGELEELCIEGMIFADAADNAPQSACFPDADAGFGYDDIIITRVRNFINTGKSISAEVTLRLGKQQ